MDIIFLYLQFFRQTADTTTTCCFPSLFQIWLLHDLGSEAEAFTAHNFSASQISGIFIRKNRRGCCWLVTLYNPSSLVLCSSTQHKKAGQPRIVDLITLNMTLNMQNSFYFLGESGSPTLGFLPTYAFLEEPT